MPNARSEAVNGKPYSDSEVQCSFEIRIRFGFISQFGLRARFEFRKLPLILHTERSYLEMVYELNELVQPQRCILVVLFVVLVEIAKDAVQHCGNPGSVSVMREHLTCKKR